MWDEYKQENFNLRAIDVMHHSGKDVFNMVKDLEIIFGKGSGSQPVSNENGMAPMWKKKSIFWELAYWEVLDARHAIDVMHLMKNFAST